MDSSVPERLVAEEKLQPGSKVIFIPDAGHQLFIENWQSFNDQLALELRETSPTNDCLS